MKHKKKLQFPHTLVIILIMILFAALLTYIVPAGSFDRITDDASGRIIVDPESYHRVEQQAMNILDIFSSIPEGMIGAAWIMSLILIIGGSFEVINSTGAINAILFNAMIKLKSKGILLVPIVMFLFSFMAATMSFAEACLAFVPIGIVLSRSLGFDSLVGIAMVTMGMNVGFTGGAYNPFTVGAAQSMVGLSMFSGAWFRFIAHGCFYIVAVFFIMKYALMIKKHPEKSFVYDIEIKSGFDNKYSQDSCPELTIRLKLVIAVIAVGFGFVLYASVMKWNFKTELPAIFLMMAIAASLVAGYSPNKIAEEFVKGAKSMLFGALVVGFARGISVVLENGMIIDTVVHSAASTLTGMPTIICSIAMLFIQTIISVFITSGSGMAAATIPIMSPIGQLLGLTQQTVVLAYQFGDGLTNQILPMSGVLMGSLAFGNVPYSKWCKFVWKMIAVNWIVAAILTAIASLINLGPY